MAVFFLESGLMGLGLRQAQPPDGLRFGHEPGFMGCEDRPRFGNEPRINEIGTSTGSATGWAKIMMYISQKVIKVGRGVLNTPAANKPSYN